MGLRLLLIILILTTATAKAEPSCLPNYNSLQTLVNLNPSEDKEFQYPLLTDNGRELLMTKVNLRAVYSAQDKMLFMKTHWSNEFNGVSLPYNLYAIMILQNGKPLKWIDYTHQCQGPGISFYPGGAVTLPPIPVKGEGPQTLQIMVWGRVL